MDNSRGFEVFESYELFKKNIDSQMMRGCLGRSCNRSEVEGAPPKISIITISYNDREALCSTIESVLRQSYSNIEYIVIDGGSSDGTADILQAQSCKIDCCISQPDKGISDAFNKGVVCSHGEVVFILNAGDVFENELSVSEMMNFYVEKSCDICFFPVNLLSENGVKKKKVPDAGSIRKKVSVMHCGTLIKLRCYKELGLYDLNKKLAMDYDLILRMCDSSSVTVAESYGLPVTIMNTSGISNSRIFEAKREVYEIQKKYRGRFLALLEYFRSFCFGLVRVILKKSGVTRV